MRLSFLLTAFREANLRNEHEEDPKCGSVATSDAKNLCGRRKEVDEERDVNDSAFFQIPVIDIIDRLGPSAH